MLKKEIPGFENYIIYEDGSVWSTYKQDFISTCFAKSTGYRQINLYSNGKRKTMGIHVLLALAFIPNPENLPIIDHIDRDRKNNNLNNLRWYDYSGNTLNHDKILLKEKYKTKYGTNHSSQNESVKNKVRKTKLEKYGDTNPSRFHSDTFKKNMLDKYGVDNPGKLGKIRKPIFAIKDDIIKEYESLTACSLDLKIHSSGICNVLRGRKKQAKGYTFKYKDSDHES